MENQESIDLYINDLLKKSQEAYLMALEIINKPTIVYRTEGFCFFICNAWELMLKAFLIKTKNNINAITYNDKTVRTISLSEAINKVFTSNTNKTRSNINFIVGIRNRATHLILPDFDFALAPLFQSNIQYYNKFLSTKFIDFKANNDITPFIAINKHQKPAESSLNIFGDAKDYLKDLKQKIDDEGHGINVKLTITKKKSDADLTVAIDNTQDSNEQTRIITKTKDINVTHPYSYTALKEAIIKTLELNLGNDHGFNRNSLNEINRDLKPKDNANWCYEVDYGKSKVKKYSSEYLEHITDNFENDVTFRNKYKKKGS